MEFIMELWLPIVLSAVAVFIVSSIIHMAIPIHRKDYTRIPNEEKVVEALRSQGVGEGNYVFPCPVDMKDMCSPQMKEKYATGPSGFLIVRALGIPSIGKSLMQWFLFSLGIGLLVAYVASLGLSHGAPFATVFRVCSAAATLGYGIGHIQDSIWKSVRWGTSMKFLVDGLLYGLATGAVFAWMWPKAM